MFEQSLTESIHHYEPRRSWSALAATTLQAGALLLMMFVPLLHLEQLAPASLPHVLVPITTPRIEVRTESSAPSSASLFALPAATLMQPTQIPARIAPASSDEAPNIFTSSPCTHDCMPALQIGSASEHPVLRGQAQNARPVISRLDPGQIVRQVQPVYPPVAKAAGIQGAVVLRAVISRVGTIENLAVLSGHPLLARAARDAVQQWRFRPYVLNGTAVEVETQITVIFKLHE